MGEQGKQSKNNQIYLLRYRRHTIWSGWYARHGTGRPRWRGVIWAVSWGRSRYRRLSSPPVITKGESLPLFIFRVYFKVSSYKKTVLKFIKRFTPQYETENWCFNLFTLVCLFVCLSPWVISLCVRPTIRSFVPSFVGPSVCPFTRSFTSSWVFWLIQLPSIPAWLAGTFVRLYLCLSVSQLMEVELASYLHCL